MFTAKDDGKEVRVRTIDGMRIQGIVSDIETSQAKITNEGGTVTVLYAEITTVTRIGEFGGE
jgi:hypothetical protein